MATRKKTRKMYRGRHARGMTLIEIMVVLVILGMIAGAIGWNVLGQLKDAEVKNATTEVKSLANAVDMFQVKHGHLPDSLNDLVPGEIRELHKDPWQQPYVYVKGGGGTDGFEVISYGPDKAPGGGDDISSAAKSNTGS